MNKLYILSWVVPVWRWCSLTPLNDIINYWYFKCSFSENGWKKYWSTPNCLLCWVYIIIFSPFIWLHIYLRVGTCTDLTRDTHTHTRCHFPILSLQTWQPAEMNHLKRHTNFHLNPNLNSSLFSLHFSLSYPWRQKHINHQFIPCGQPLPLDPINLLNKPQLNWLSLHQNGRCPWGKGRLMIPLMTVKQLMTTQGEERTFLDYSPFTCYHTIWSYEPEFQQLIIYNFKNNLLQNSSYFCGMTIVISQGCLGNKPTRHSKLARSPSFICQSHRAF